MGADLAPRPAITSSFSFAALHIGTGISHRGLWRVWPSSLSLSYPICSGGTFMWFTPRSMTPGSDSPRPAGPSPFRVHEPGEHGGAASVTDGVRGEGSRRVYQRSFSYRQKKASSDHSESEELILKRKKKVIYDVLGCNYKSTKWVQILRKTFFSPPTLQEYYFSKQSRT